MDRWLGGETSVGAGLRRSCVPGVGQGACAGRGMRLYRRASTTRGWPDQPRATAIVHSPLGKILPFAALLISSQAADAGGRLFAGPGVPRGPSRRWVFCSIARRAVPRRALVPLDPRALPLWPPPATGAAVVSRCAPGNPPFHAPLGRELGTLRWRSGRFMTWLLRSGGVGSRGAHRMAAVQGLSRRRFLASDTVV